MGQTEDRQAQEARLAQWLSRPPGRDLVERERACVQELVADLVGYYSLQVGWSLAFGGCLAHSRIRFHLSMEALDPGCGQGLNLLADPRAFPLANDALDLVFLPHTLDLTPDPRQVLREAERVLIPEGRLVVTGFNGWGRSRLLGAAVDSPWRGRGVGARRLLDWLALLGFQIENSVAVSFLPPCGSRAWTLHRTEALGRRWLPSWSSLYALRAVKRVATLTPLTPVWRARSRLLPGQAVEPSARRGPDG